MIVDSPADMRKLDSRDILPVLDAFPEHCEKAIDIGKEFIKKLKIRKQPVAVLGMGGSAISGLISKDVFPELQIDVFNGYELPEYVDREWLVIAITYSGKTEETLTMLDQAVKRKCGIISISSGRELKAFCNKRSIPFLEIPSGFPPRFALPYMLFPLLLILGKMVKGKKDFRKVISDLKITREDIKSGTPFNHNVAKRSAFRIQGTIPLIMATPSYAAVGYRGKTQFNENAKIQAFNETFPELNHNSLLAWQKPDSISKAFSVILISDHKEHPQIRKRFDFTRPYVKHSARNVIYFHSVFRSRLSRMLSVLYILDFMSVYLAFFYMRDPGDDRLLGELKKSLRK